MKRSSVISVLFAAVVAAPVAWLFIMSFKAPTDIFAGVSKAFFVPTLENYRNVLDRTFLTSFLNSTITSVVSTALSLLIGVPGAYVLARAGVGRTRWISICILATRMIPPVAFTIPYFLIYRHVGLLDTLAGLIIIYITFNLALVVWLMRNFFEGIPVSLEEAAFIDGATRWQAFRYIVLPLCKPALVTTAILCFLYSWNDFFFALILTRNNAVTAPLQVINFLNYEGWEWGNIAAGGILIMLPVLLFSVLLRRYLVAGMTAGAVK